MVCVCLHVNADVHRDQKRVSVLLEVDLQAVVAWVLGTELWSLKEHYTLLRVKPSLQPL